MSRTKLTIIIVCLYIMIDRELALTRKLHLRIYINVSLASVGQQKKLCSLVTYDISGESRST
jgi:hypothetical protein